MIALDELTYTIKRMELIINNADSLEERTMARVIHDSLLNMVGPLEHISPAEFAALCQQEEFREKEQEKEDTR
jgi:hypothetical protein